jgi:hypothetical protein
LSSGSRKTNKPEETQNNNNDNNNKAQRTTSKDQCKDVASPQVMEMGKELWKRMGERQRVQDDVDCCEEEV